MSDFPAWVEKCQLWGQVNLQEHDPAAIDVERWREYWRETRIDGVTLNAGGIIHYYPSAQPLAWLSPWLKGRDLLGELVAAARELNLRILARFTPSRVDARVAAEHPDWCVLDADGQPRVDPDHDPGEGLRLYFTCWNGPYYRHYLPQVMFREVMERYDVDGFFFNWWQSSERSRGPCQCPVCRRQFREASGYVLPVAPAWGDPAWHAWLDWYSACAASLAEQWNAAARLLKPEAIAVLNLGHGIEGLTTSGNDWKALCAPHAMIDADHQARSPGEPIWSIGATGKIVRSVIGGKPYYHLFGVYGGGGRISAQPEAEHTLMMADAVASGARLWYHVVGATGEDRRPFDRVARFFRWYDEHREVLAAGESLADVALVYSQRGVDHYGRTEARRLQGEPFRGAYHTLVRVPTQSGFDVLHEQDLNAAALSRYQVVVLPNIACLSDAQCAALAGFVERGGGLVATFETSRCDKDGRRRPDFGLAEVLGVRAATELPVGPVPRCYVRLEGDALRAGLEGTEVVPADLYHVPLAAAEGTVALTLVPSISHMPPERAFFRIPRTGTALALLRRHGEGRVAYFACDLDRLCAARNNPDHRRLLENAIRWVRTRPPMVEVEGPGLVDVHAYRQEGRVVVHLVNCANADLWQPPATEVVPLGEQVVRVRGDLAGTLRQARLLRRGETVLVDFEDGAAVARVPWLEAYEVVVLE